MCLLLLALSGRAHLYWIFFLFFFFYFFYETVRILQMSFRGRVRLEGMGEFHSLFPARSTIMGPKPPQIHTGCLLCPAIISCKCSVDLAPSEIV